MQPRIHTTYQAKFDNAASATLTVNVRPRITLQKVGRNSFLVVVLAQHSMAGKTIDVARWTGQRLDDGVAGAAPEHRAHEHGRGRARHVAS